MRGMAVETIVASIETQNYFNFKSEAGGQRMFHSIMKMSAKIVMARGNPVMVGLS